MRLILAKRLLNDPGHNFFFSRSRATATQKHTATQACRCVKTSSTHGTHTSRRELPQRSREGDPGDRKPG